MSWDENGRSEKERVGPVNVIAELSVEPAGRERGEWSVFVMGGRTPPLLAFEGFTEAKAKEAARRLELALCSVASWAARECDTETTRRDVVTAMEDRIRARGEKVESFHG